jgi:hypothetical protein
MSGQQDALLAIGRDPAKPQWVKMTIRRDDGQEMWVSLDPDNAVDVAEAIAKEAYHAKYGKPSPLVHTLKDEILAKKREKLINRCKLVAPQLLERGRSNEYIVTELIDIVLAEVT